jgi:hypothetical protein
MNKEELEDFTKEEVIDILVELVNKIERDGNDYLKKFYDGGREDIEIYSYGVALVTKVNYVKIQVALKNNRYNKIVDEVYKNYYNKTKDLTFNDFEVKGNGIITITGFDMKSINFYGTASGSITSAYFRPFTKEEFIDKCKTHNEFSEKWGLKIEERELSDKERAKIYWNEKGIENPMLPALRKDIDNSNVPTRVITVTYNNETIEIYE